MMARVGWKNFDEIFCIVEFFILKMNFTFCSNSEVKFTEYSPVKTFCSVSNILHLLCALCDLELFTASFSLLAFMYSGSGSSRRSPCFPIFPIDTTLDARSCCLWCKTARWRRARRASRMTIAALSTRSCCAWPRDARLWNFLMLLTFKRLPVNSPFKTCTRMLATMAFDGEQLYLPELDSSAFWISRCEVVMSPLRVSIEMPPRSES